MKMYEEYEDPRIKNIRFFEEMAQKILIRMQTKENLDDYLQGCIDAYKLAAKHMEKQILVGI